MERPSSHGIGFIGVGVVGSALAQALSTAGYAICALSSRNREHREGLAGRLPGATPVDRPQAVADRCDLVFLTVSDDAIEPVARSIRWREGQSVVHCNGARTAELLAHARDAGASVGVLHPLQSFATVEQALANLPGSAFGIEASSPELLTRLEEMARALGGLPLVLRGDRTLYHASAVFACNYLVTLLDVAAELWQAFGRTREEAMAALLPLVRGTVENLETLGLPKALTGPIARGDAGTIERHLDALRAVAPETLTVYKELARRTIPIALAKGRIDSHAADRLRAVLDREAGGEAT